MLTTSWTHSNKLKSLLSTLDILNKKNKSNSCNLTCLMKDISNT